MQDGGRDRTPRWKWSRKYSSTDDLLDRFLVLQSITRLAAAKGIDYAALSENNVSRPGYREPDHPLEIYAELWRLERVFQRLRSEIDEKRWALWVLRKVGRLSWREVARHARCPWSKSTVIDYGAKRVAEVDQRLSDIMAEERLFLAPQAARRREAKRNAG